MWRLAMAQSPVQGVLPNFCKQNVETQKTGADCVVCSSSQKVDDIL
jgi:hypothetical protein